MEKYSIYIDESGDADPSHFDKSSYFTLCGVVSSNKSRDSRQEKVDALKIKYFGKKSYILHSVNLNFHLKTPDRIEKFASDLDSILNSEDYFLLFVVVDQEKAFGRNWQKKTVYKNAYRALISNLIKFLIAKKVQGAICAEASKLEQDMHLYESFFHFIANGIDRLSITPEDVKKHLTALTFVTKINNDSEEQFADLFGVCGKLKCEIELKKRDLNELFPITSMLMKRMDQKLFRGSPTAKGKKKKLYANMNSFIKLP
jgi:hypothetical protein